MGHDRKPDRCPRDIELRKSRLHQWCVFVYVRGCVSKVHCRPACSFGDLTLVAPLMSWFLLWCLSSQEYTTPGTALYLIKSR